MSTEGDANQPGLPCTSLPTIPTSSVHHVNAKVPILLQIARAEVYKIEFPQFTQKVRILLDSGSQMSYI